MKKCFGGKSFSAVISTDVGEVVERTTTQNPPVQSKWRLQVQSLSPRLLIVILSRG